MSNSVNFNISFVAPPLPDIQVLKYAFVRNMRCWDNPDRTAPFWRFYWNFTPGAALTTPERTYELTPERPALIPPYVRFASRGTRTFDQFYIHFNAAVPPGTPDFPIFLRHIGGAELARSIAADFEGELENIHFRLYGVVLNALTELVDRRAEFAAPSRRLDPRIAAALEVMNGLDRRSNAELARNVCMSKDNFVLLFRRALGIAPQHYLNSRRMEKAQNLLLESDLSIDDICKMLGFPDRFTFSKRFRAHFGTAPGRYRRGKGMN